MALQSEEPSKGSLYARPVAYQYKYCPRCRREWPAKHRSCPECVHWLGEHPLERTEWQFVPRQAVAHLPHRYELIGASALTLRVVSAEPPTNEQLAQVCELVREVVSVGNGGSVCEVAGYGWLLWTVDDLRRAFRIACEMERRFMAALPRLEGAFLHCGRIRWGVWVDQYVVPFDEQENAVIGEASAKAIFKSEPDAVVLLSEAVYQVNRRWENFVGAPHRLLDGQESWSYRFTGRKRPSALDHASARELGPFVGRERELSRIESCWKNSDQTVKLAITAAAGSGKTRLIKEWLRRHPDIQALAGNFSLFGGSLEDFASQLAELPPDRLDRDALVRAAVERVNAEAIRVLVVDDLHWADAVGLGYVCALLANLPPGMLVVLAARPSGRQQLRTLSPDVELELNTLPAKAVDQLARQLTSSDKVATAAALRSKGNPLFVEQFAAWAAEANFSGGPSGPRTLHQIIAARIEYLSKVRIADIRQRLRWGGSWGRKEVEAELQQLEAEVGLWLDRLETGDYGDRVDAARHLTHLERLDYEIFLASMLLGRPRPRSGRLREAIERLLIGSADEVLVDLKRRTAKANRATRLAVSQEAQRVGDALFAACNWALAGEFYGLAYSDALWDRDEIGRRLEQCRRRCRHVISDDDEIYSVARSVPLDERPNVGALDLPYVWADLGLVYHCSAYFVRAGEAAIAINDRALADWAKRKVAELAESEGKVSRGLIDETLS